MQSIGKVVGLLLATCWVCQTLAEIDTVTDSRLFLKKSKLAVELIAFGDSLTDIGQTFLDTKSSWPSAEIYPNHCFSNQLTWFGYLPKLRLCGRSHECEVSASNYAVGGATTDNTANQGYTGPYSTWPVPGAAQQFEMYSFISTNKGAQKVFLITAGVNDLFFDWAAGTPITTEAVNAGIIQNVATLAETISQFIGTENGPKPLIIISNCYPVETVPYLLSYPASLFAGVTELFNKYVSIQVAQLQTTLTNVIVKEFNLSSIMYDAIHNPPRKVISTNTSCVQGDYYSAEGVCKNPLQYVYYDSFHPTSWVHQRIATEMAALIRSVLS